MKKLKVQPLVWWCQYCNHSISNHSYFLNLEKGAKALVQCEDCQGYCAATLTSEQAYIDVLAKMTASIWHRDLWKGLGS